jgi:hypothetical protein
LQLLLSLFPKISTSLKSSKHEIETQNFNIIKTSTTKTHNFNKIQLRKPKTKLKSKPRISTKLNRIQKTKNETEIETHIFNKIKPRKTKLKTQKRIATETQQKQTQGNDHINWFCKLDLLRKLDLQIGFLQTDDLSSFVSANWFFVVQN